MRTFVRHILLFCGINALVLGYLYAIYDVPADYLAALNDKLDRLSVKESPRLIFIGGSSVAWSNHSSLAAEQLDFGVENFAIHAGMGLTLRLNEARQLAREGDVLVISIEWGVFKDEPWARKMAEVVVSCPRMLRFMNVRDRKIALDGLLTASRIPLNAFIDDAKSNRLKAFTHASAQNRKQWRLRKNFNEYGDFTGHYNTKPIGIEDKDVQFATLEQLQDGIRRLNELHDELQARGVRVYYFIPVIPRERYERHRELASQQVETLIRELKIPILNPDDFLFRDEDYFDSCYHMRSDSGAARTQLLIDRLREQL